MSESQHPALTRHRVRQNTGSLDLKHRFKLHERLIQSALFTCGFVSILTTIGIILVLGNESISFFHARPMGGKQSHNFEGYGRRDDNLLPSSRAKRWKLSRTAAPSESARKSWRLSNSSTTTLRLMWLGTGGGFARFCASDQVLAETGKSRPHIVNASRVIKADELIVVLTSASRRSPSTLAGMRLRSWSAQPTTSSTS